MAIPLKDVIKELPEHQQKNIAIRTAELIEEERKRQQLRQLFVIAREKTGQFFDKQPSLKIRNYSIPKENLTENVKRKRERLEELRQKETLTDAEMNELHPPGTYLSIHSKTLGIVNLDRAFLNFVEASSRYHHAMEHGCYMEAINLQVQYAEFWLRIYWVKKNKKGAIYDSKNKETFGTIIRKCEQLGLDLNIVKKLLDFNDARIDTVHKYMLGEIDYDSLREICILNKGLTSQVFECVMRDIAPEIFTDNTH